MAGSQLVQSVLRAADVLEAVAASDGGLSLTELSSRVGLNTTTVHNLARTLAARGYLEKASRPARYRIGPAAFELVSRREASDVVARAEVAMAELAGRHPEATLTYSEPREGEVAVVLRMSPQRAGVVERPADRRLSPYTSASAVVQLAYADAGERAAVERRYPFEEFGLPLFGSYEAFSEQVDSVRKRGGAVLAGRKSLLPMAAPVWVRGALAGVIGMALPHEVVESGGVSADQLFSEIKQAAAGLSA